jgi:hypothetical protein
MPITTFIVVEIANIHMLNVLSTYLVSMLANFHPLIPCECLSAIPLIMLSFYCDGIVVVIFVVCYWTCNRTNGRKKQVLTSGLA